ncbi:outer membrane protein assembly factor BamB family protein [Pilimelia terevasa]|uniref:outer membrane protein assembly factor BamB family protein n=1 Tax=Pilimelia terevasa TaxID=53372 RepID=UPI001E4E98A4|nr:PQQ-binding-like beta-propeller repeat protein [Pilimelia terevasa]
MLHPLGVVAEAGGVVRLLALADGATRWERNVPAQGAEVTLCRSGDTVLAIWPAVAGAAGGITALAIADGRELWRRPVPALLRGESGGQYVAIAAQRDGGESVTVFEAATGKEMLALDRVAGFRSALVQGVLLAQSTGGTALAAYRVAGGEKLWQLADHWTHLVAGDSRHCYTFGPDGRYYGLATATGRQRWSTRTPLDGQIGVGPTEYCAATDTRVWCVEAATGIERWRVTPPPPVGADPAPPGRRWLPTLADDYVCLTGRGELAVLDAADGSITAQVQFPAKVQPLTYAAGRLAHMADGATWLHALD